MIQTLEVTENKSSRDTDIYSEIKMSEAWASFGECVRKIAASIVGAGVIENKGK